MTNITCNFLFSFNSFVVICEAFEICAIIYLLFRGSAGIRPGGASGATGAGRSGGARSRRRCSEVPVAHDPREPNIHLLLMVQSHRHYLEPQTPVIHARTRYLIFF